MIIDEKFYQDLKAKEERTFSDTPIGVDLVFKKNHKIQKSDKQFFDFFFDSFDRVHKLFTNSLIKQWNNGWRLNKDFDNFNIRIKWEFMHPEFKED